MSKDEKEICENCQYWRSRIRFENASSLRQTKRGDCRVGRPIPVEYVGHETEAAWPGTNPDDWCGEFTSRPGDLEFARGELEKIGCQANTEQVEAPHRAEDSALQSGGEVAAQFLELADQHFASDQERKGGYTADVFTRGDMMTAVYEGAHAYRRAVMKSRDAELLSARTRIAELEIDHHIAGLIHSIFSYGEFHAESFNEVVVQHLFELRGTPIKNSTPHPKMEEWYHDYLSDLEDTEHQERLRKNQCGQIEERSDTAKPAAESQPDTTSFQSIGDLASRVLAQAKAKMELNP